MSRRSTLVFSNMMACRCVSVVHADVHQLLDSLMKRRRVAPGSSRTKVREICLGTRSLAGPHGYRHYIKLKIKAIQTE